MSETSRPIRRRLCQSRPSFRASSKPDRDNYYKCNNPDQKRKRGRQFQPDTEQLGQHHDRHHLHAAADPGNLHHRSERNKPHKDQNIHKC